MIEEKRLQGKKELKWKRRIEGDIYKETERRHKFVDKRLERGIRIEEETKNERPMRKIQSQEKGLKIVIEELKQRMLAKSAKVKRYE